MNTASSQNEIINDPIILANELIRRIEANPEESWFMGNGDYHYFFNVMNRIDSSHPEYQELMDRHRILGPRIKLSDYKNRLWEFIKWVTDPLNTSNPLDNNSLTGIQGSMNDANKFPENAGEIIALKPLYELVLNVERAHNWAIEALRSHVSKISSY